MRKLIPLLVAGMLLTGCGDFWRDQGDAAQTNADARRIAAQAQRDNAQAQIIDAQARGVLAESQAEALTTSVDAVVELSTVDDKYATIFAVLLFLVIGSVVAIAALVIHRGFRPVPVAQEQFKPLGYMLPTPHGFVPIIQEPGETTTAFFMRIEQAKALAEKEVIHGYLSQ